MPVPARVSVVTLGVAAVPRAAAYYQALGREPSGEVEERFAVFRTADAPAGAVFAGGHRRGGGAGAGGPGNDAHRPRGQRRFSGAGGRGAGHGDGGSVAAPAQERFWGGSSGYFADPDGHAWEVAFNPFWPLGEDGLPQLV